MRVFISKNEADCSSLIQWKECNRFAWTFKSLISTSPVEFEKNGIFDWLFFGSKNAVKYYVKKTTISSKEKIACIGESTAAEFLKIGVKPSFIGKNSGKPSEIGQELKKIVKNERIFFPESNISKKTISSLFSTEQKCCEVVYQTIPEEVVISDCDIYVFTSPSNVISYLKNNNLPVSARVIAWGETTALELLSQKQIANVVLENSSMTELKTELLKLI